LEELKGKGHAKASIAEAMVLAVYIPHRPLLLGRHFGYSFEIFFVHGSRQPLSPHCFKGRNDIQLSYLLKNIPEGGSLHH